MKHDDEEKSREDDNAELCRDMERVNLGREKSGILHSLPVEDLTKPIHLIRVPALNIMQLNL